MDPNINISENLESNVYFSAKLLNIVCIIGIVAAALSVLPWVFTIDNGFPIDTVSDIGGKMTSLVDIVFISLISYKIYKDGITKPPYMLLACFASLLGLDFIVNLLSEEIGFITSIICILGSIGIGFIFLMSENTKKIGVWLLLSMAGSVILLAIVLNDEFENSNKWLGIGLAALYWYPYAKYLESCQKFLTPKEGEV